MEKLTIKQLESISYLLKKCGISEIIINKHTDPHFLIDYDFVFDAEHNLMSKESAIEKGFVSFNYKMVTFHSPCI